MSKRAAENERLVRRFVAAYSAGDLDAALEMVAEDYVAQDAARLTGGITRGRDAFARTLRSIRQTLPDVREEFLDLVASDDKVAFWIKATGHHTGTEWMGVTAHGAAVAWECLGIWYVRDGKLAGEVYLDDVPAIEACLRQAG